MCLAYAAVAILAAWFLVERTLIGFVAIMVVATAVFLTICVRKTRGGWRWRAGGKD